MVHLLTRLGKEAAQRQVQDLLDLQMVGLGICVDGVKEVVSQDKPAFVGGKTAR